MENGGTCIIRTTLLSTSLQGPEPEIVRSKDRALGRAIYKGLAVCDGPWAEDLNARLSGLRELRRLLGNEMKMPSGEPSGEGGSVTNATMLPPSLPMPIKERAENVVLRRVLYAKRFKKERLGVMDVPRISISMSSDRY